MSKKISICLVLFILNFSLGILYKTDKIGSIDSDIRKNFIKTFLSDKSFSVEKKYLCYSELVKEYKGKAYMHYLPGLSLIAIPFYLLGKSFGKSLENIDHGVLLFNLLLGSISIVLFFNIAVKFFSSKISLSLSLIFLTTPFLSFYQKTFFSEPLILLINLYLFHHLTTGKETKGEIIGVNFILFLGMITKYPFIITLVIFLLISVIQNGVKKSIRYLPGVLLCFLFVFWYKYGQFGFQNINKMHSTGFFLINYFKYFLTGVSGLWFSTGRGLLVLSPVLIFGLLYLNKIWKKFLFPIGLILGYTFFYGGWAMWYGGACFGPRFLVPVYPFLLLPIGFLWKEKKKMIQILFISFYFVSVFVYIQSVRVDTFKLFSTMQKVTVYKQKASNLIVRNRLIYQDLNWKWEYSPQFFYPLLDTNYLSFKNVYQKKGLMLQKILFSVVLFMFLLCIIKIYQIMVSL